MKSKGKNNLKWAARFSVIAGSALLFMAPGASGPPREEAYSNRLQTFICSIYDYDKRALLRKLLTVEATASDATTAVSIVRTQVELQRALHREEKNVITGTSRVLDAEIISVYCFRYL